MRERGLETQTHGETETKIHRDKENRDTENNHTETQKTEIGRHKDTATYRYKDTETDKSIDKDT